MYYYLYKWVVLWICFTCTQGEYKQQQAEETLYAEPILVNQNKPLNPLGQYEGM